MTAKPREHADLKAAMLWDVLCDPADDDARLIFADWLDDHDCWQQAEFIRYWVKVGDKKLLGVQAGKRAYWSRSGADKGEAFDLVVPAGCQSADWCRGFVDHVTLTTADFLGTECGRCGGRGFYGEYDHDNPLSSYPPEELTPEGLPKVPCRDCDGTGHVGGHARAIFEAHPITRVTLADREPYPNSSVSRAAWFHPVVPPVGNRATIPETLFRLMVGFDNNGMSETRVKWYPTEDAALAALSFACVRYARRLVGLPEIGGEG